MGPDAIVLAGHGINCEEETAYALKLAGAKPVIRHVDDLFADPKELLNYRILAVPGGFSYGDETGSGKVLAVRMRHHLGEYLQEFVEKDNLAIDICNGFQVITALGVLADPAEGKPTVALMHNTNPRYRCDWVEVIGASDKCVWTRGIERMDIPIAHGEGRFYAPDDVLSSLKQNGQVALRYSRDGAPANGVFPYNPNGSLDDIAGICDPSGRVFGLMPHPERYLSFTNHPDWPLRKEQLRRAGKPIPTEGAGLQIFRNAVEYFR